MTALSTVVHGDNSHSTLAIRDLRDRTKAVLVFVRCVAYLAAASVAGCATYISGTVASYLVNASNPVVIYNNGSLVGTVTSSGPFGLYSPGSGAFGFNPASNYSISVTAPPGENCLPMVNWSGIPVGAFGGTVSGIQISCYPMYISGTLSGYTPGTAPITVGITTTNYLANGGVQVADGFLGTVSQNGLFRFPTYSSNNQLSVAAAGSTNCQMANGDAQMTGALTTVTNVEIFCQSITPPEPGWAPLTSQVTGVQYLSPLLLLSDGTVIANETGTTHWYRLTPDSFGSYVKGTWSALPDSICPHGQFASQVLHDGRVFIAGGELPGPIGYSSSCAQSNQSYTGVDTEIFDPNPSVNSWSAATPPASLIDPNSPQNFSGYCTTQAFGDMTSELLDDGRVLMAPVCPKNCGDTLLFDPKPPTSGWVTGVVPKLANPGNTVLSCDEEETSWVKLPDGSVLTADPPTAPGLKQTSERFMPLTNTWVKDADLGFSLFNQEWGEDWGGYNGEMGPAFALPGGGAIFVGGNSHYGIYTPGTPGPPGSAPAQGTWQQMTLVPTGGPATQGADLAADDKPGAMMPNGKILLALNFATTSNDNYFPAPVFFYEFDPNSQPANAFTEVAGPPGADLNPWADCGLAGGNVNSVVYFNTMLVLPDGGILMPGNCNQSQMYVYRSASGTAPAPAGTPTIDSGPANGVAPGAAVTQPNPATNTFTVSGSGFTGISDGASYGDDAQMASNYPLVRLTDSQGRVIYARTHDWMKGAPDFAQFDVPLTTPPNAYALQVVVNGNPSASVSFNWQCPLLTIWFPLVNRCV